MPTKTPIQPLFPEPLSEDYPEDGPRPTEETVDLWGHHANWCAVAQENHAEDVQKVSDHGRWCEGGAHYSDGHAPDGKELMLRVCGAVAYHHGVYPADIVRHPVNSTMALLEVSDPRAAAGEGDVISELFVSAQEARRLSRALLYVADMLDGFDRPAPRQWP